MRVPMQFKAGVSKEKLLILLPMLLGVQTFDRLYVVSSRAALAHSAPPPSHRGMGYEEIRWLTGEDRRKSVIRC